MKIAKSFFIALILAGAVWTVSADDAPATKVAPKPDKLTTCPVSRDQLGEMGKPFVFVYKGQEVKLCCTSCKADFDKDPAKYIKKIETAAKTPAPVAGK
jgi:YHS domain-containing protein